MLRNQWAALWLDPHSEKKGREAEWAGMRRVQASGPALPPGGPRENGERWCSRDLRLGCVYEAALCRTVEGQVRS